MRQKVDAFLMKIENIKLTTHSKETLTMICLLLMNLIIYTQYFGNKYLVTCYCTQGINNNHHNNSGRKIKSLFSKCVLYFRGYIKFFTHSPLFSLKFYGFRYYYFFILILSKLRPRSSNLSKSPKPVNIFEHSSI